jgi:hypothetical protein
MPDFVFKVKVIALAQCVRLMSALRVRSFLQWPQGDVELANENNVAMGATQRSLMFMFLFVR